MFLRRDWNDICGSVTVTRYPCMHLQNSIIGAGSEVLCLRFCFQDSQQFALCRAEGTMAIDTPVTEPEGQEAVRTQDAR
jgi:hypothetical protein